MKLTFDWLKDHLNTNLKEKNLLAKLTNIGLEVEKVENALSGIPLFGGPGLWSSCSGFSHFFPWD